MATVDITILSWDRIEDTILAIESGLQQTGVDARVIVVDQGSTVENVGKLRHYCRDKQRLSVVYGETNLGVPGGRNLAANQNDGDYIVGLDNDAEFIDSTQLQKAVEIMEANPDIGVLGFRVLRFGSQEDDQSSWYYWQDVHESANMTFETTHFVGAGHMIRRDAFKQVEGYDDILFFMQEEMDLSERIINAGYRIVYSPDVVIGHKVSAEHRVQWTGKRWQFNVRNGFYLHIKRGTRLPTLIFHTFLYFRRGSKAGMFFKTLSGLWQGICLIPNALRERSKDPTNKATAKASQYRKSCSENEDMSTYQRIKMRLRKAGLAPGHKYVSKSKESKA